MFDNRRSNEITGFLLLIWLTVGLVFIPMVCVVTLARDGFDETPWWMTIIAVATIALGAAALVGSLTNGTLLPH